MAQASNPFHAGELKAQARVGAKDVSEWAAGFIRPFMPQQHRSFFSGLPFLVLAGADRAGRHWVTLLDGPDGFVHAPDDRTLELAAAPDPQDPLSETLLGGSDIGVLGIELATRRRNRLSGSSRANGSGVAIDVRQSFGNCPQYIHERSCRRVVPRRPQLASYSTALSTSQISRIRVADTLFIGTGQRGQSDHPSNGFDASHRGGAPGFVDVIDPTHLRIPDYAGNNFFNTIGNLMEDPRIGLVFVDFETGGLLHVSGRATIDWDMTNGHDPAALRMIDVAIDAVLDRPEALSLRWSNDDTHLRELIVADKVKETKDITSFYLSAADGKPLDTFEPGQHLPIELEIPGQPGQVGRSYSLSGEPDSDFYRLSIKREARGLASQFLHDNVHVGDRISAHKPGGDFVIPCDSCPLVLVSAGVGFTPMLSMLHTALGESKTRPVWYVHGARDGEQHALKREVAALDKDHPNLTICTIYSQPSTSDRLGVDYHGTGHITVETLLNLGPGPSAHYMLCGPAKFLADLRIELEKAGIEAQRIHFENFGPAA